MTDDALAFLRLVLTAGQARILRPRGAVQRARTSPILPVSQLGHTIDEIVERIGDPAWPATRAQAAVLSCSTRWPHVVRRGSSGGWRITSLGAVAEAVSA